MNIGREESGKARAMLTSRTRTMITRTARMAGVMWMLEEKGHGKLQGLH